MDHKQIILDFTTQANLKVDELKFLNDNIVFITKKFDQYLCDLKKYNIKFKNYFVLSLFNSNNFSDLYYLICKIEILKNYLDNNKKIKKIIIDDQSTKNIYLQILNSYSSHAEVEVIVDKISIFKHFKKLFILIYKIFIDYLATRLVKLNNKFSEKIALIETFLSSENIRENFIIDNYFGKYDNYLTKKDLQKLVVFPRLLDGKTLSLKKIFNLLKKIKYNNRRFLIDISMLNINDYFFCFFSTIFITNKNYIIPKYDNINLNEFCNFQITKDFANLSILSNFYRMRSIKKLSKTKASITSVVSWYENQSIDKTSIFYFKKYFPKVILKSYHGYYLFFSNSSLFLSNFEIENNLAPDYICCISRNCIDKYSSLINFKQINLVPGYRYEYLNDLCSNKIEKKDKKILISLSLLKEEVKRLLSFANFIVKDFDHFQITIAFHPRYQKKTIDSFVSEHLTEFAKKKILVSNQLSNKIIQDYDLVLTYNSHIANEASFLNIPVGISANLKGSTMNPLSSGIIDNYSFVFYEYSELKKNISIIMNNEIKYHNKYISLINEKTIIKPTAQNTKSFFLND